MVIPGLNAADAWVASGIPGVGLGLNGVSALES